MHKLLRTKRPYLEGRKVKKAAGIPHMFDSEKDGTVIQSYYGYGPKITRIEGQGNGGNILDLTDESVNQILSTGFMKNPTYQNGRGPIKVKVIDPLNVPNSTFTVKFLKLPSTPYTSTFTPIPNQWSSVSTTTNTYANGQAYVATGSIARNDSITWVLTNLSNNKIYQPNKSIKVGEEFYFSELGLSVSIEQVPDPGGVLTGTVAFANANPGDFLEGTMTFADPTKQWLTGLADTDDGSPTNWIRSGENISQSPTDYNDYLTDPDRVFAKVLEGTWSPYNLTGSTKKNATGTGIAVPAGPGYSGNFFATNDGNKPADTDFRFLSSVDVVFTPDKSKWTRCVVLEMQDDSLLSENVTRHFSMRDHASVDKNGNIGDGIVSMTDPNDADYISNKSMGWFPGYAINLETGERLNMAFGEDSYNFTDNGNDMRWNPTSRVSSNTYDNAFGGRHYIYVFGHNKDATYGPIMNGPFAGAVSLTNTPIGAGRYDAGKQIYDQMRASNSLSTTVGTAVGGLQWPIKNVMFDAMWVNVPLLESSQYAFKDPANMPCEAKVRLRVRKPYRFGYSTVWANRIPSTATNYVANNLSTGYLVSTAPINLPSDISTTPQNNDLPMYQFSTDDIYTMFGNGTAAKNALDYVRIVPNPYYAYSKYESRRIDNIVRVTNLPSVCTIKIFTMNGTLVRTFKRDVSGQEDEYTSDNDTKQSKRSPYLDWDLKNQYGIPVASGLYIFHIDAPGVGEKILKWFGVMRPIDLQNY
ncbi:MAG: hypothetical protein IPJ32_11475 [Sphingobacteriaceae bacterium]|nr:hypothetical protein [Sphingobacteriaceae bacterium]